MVNLTFAVIKSFSWKLKLSQLNYFTRNFCNYLNSSCIFTKRKTLRPVVNLRKFPEQLVNEKVARDACDFMSLKP